MREYHNISITHLSTRQDQTNPLIPDHIKAASTLPLHTSWHTAPTSCLRWRQSVRKRAPGAELWLRRVVSGELQLLEEVEEVEAGRRTISVQSWQPRMEKMPRSPWGNYKVLYDRGTITEVRQQQSACLRGRGLLIAGPCCLSTCIFRGGLRNNRRVHVSLKSITCCAPRRRCDDLVSRSEVR